MHRVVVSLSFEKVVIPAGSRLARCSAESLNSIESFRPSKSFAFEEERHQGFLPSWQLDVDGVVDFVVVIRSRSIQNIGRLGFQGRSEFALARLANQSFEASVGTTANFAKVSCGNRDHDLQLSQRSWKDKKSDNNLVAHHVSR